MALLAPVLASLAVLPAHLGALHGYEQAVVWALAFGPFLVLAAVVHVVRRRDRADEGRPAGGSAAGAGEPEPADLPLASERLRQHLRDE